MAERSNISTDFLAKVEIGYYIPNTIRFLNICNSLDTTPNHLLHEFINNKDLSMEEIILDDISKLDYETKKAICLFIKNLPKRL